MIHSLSGFGNYWGLLLKYWLVKKSTAKFFSQLQALTTMGHLPFSVEIDLLFCSNKGRICFNVCFYTFFSVSFSNLLYLENYTLRLLHAVTIATFQPHSQSSLLPVPKEREFYPNAMLLSFNGTTDKIHSISVWTEHVKHTTSARAVSLSTRTWKRWNGFSHWHHKRFKTLQLRPSHRMEAIFFK